MISRLYFSKDELCSYTQQTKDKTLFKKVNMPYNYSSLKKLRSSDDTLPNIPFNVVLSLYNSGRIKLYSIHKITMTMK